MTLRRALGAALLIVALTPAAARADGMIIPFVGWNFGGDSGKDFSNAVDADRLNWGVSFALMGGGVFGLEADFAYSPDFFGKTDIGGSSVLSVMGNLVLGVPIGGQQGFGVRPYAVVGVGLIRSEINAFGDPFEVDEDKIGWNFGGGLIIFFATHVGFRADLRYFRSFEKLDLLDLEVVESPGALDFTRGSVGLVLRF
jgi:opacity protein-like surface antigen